MRMRRPSAAASAILLLTAAAHAAGRFPVPEETNGWARGGAIHSVENPGSLQEGPPAPDQGQAPAPGQTGPDPAGTPDQGGKDQGTKPSDQGTKSDQNGKPAPGDQPKPTMQVFDRLEVQGILGKEVRSGSDENMGRIIDVIVDRSGQARAAIIDFGGFLGVGNRKVAVAWNALRFPPDPKKSDRIGLDLNREQVQAAPEYKEDKPVVVLGASGGLESLPFP